jgi:hypothetical protein
VEERVRNGRACTPAGFRRRTDRRALGEGRRADARGAAAALWLWLRFFLDGHGCVDGGWF